MKYEELQPGVCLGDAHYLGKHGGLEKYLNTEVSDGVKVMSSVTLKGGLHMALDIMLQANGVVKPCTTNKCIYVIGAGNSNHLTIGWSYDNNWICLAEIRQDRRQSNAH